MPRTKSVVSELANAMQTVALLSNELRRKAGVTNVVAVDLEAAVGRAVRAMKLLQPREKRGPKR